MEAVFDVILTKEFYYPFLKLWLGIWIVAFILQLFISAPYGRHARSGWGFLLLNSFAFLTMEIVSPIVLDFFFYISPQEKNSMDYLFLLLWNIHYFQRSIIYPLRLQPRKNVSVLVWLFAIFFNIVNGYINGFDLFHLHAHRYSYQDIFTFNFILGFVLFVVGLGINIHSDDILIRLTQPKAKSEDVKDGQKSHYKIPNGGLFSLVSAPNYFGEIIEWTGFFLMTKNLANFVFLLTTIGNLLPRALVNHKWYKQQFPNYPPQRRALIPYIL